jgi:hypothetical protein
MVTLNASKFKLVYIYIYNKTPPELEPLTSLFVTLAAFPYPMNCLNGVDITILSVQMYNSDKSYLRFIFVKYFQFFSHRQLERLLYFIHSISSLSHDRPKASSKASFPHSAI